MVCLSFVGAVQADRKPDWSVVELGAFTPSGLNNRGDVVGTMHVAGAFGCCDHPMVWRNGAIIDLLPPGMTTGQAVAVNARGSAVLQFAFGQIFLSRNGEATQLPFAGVARNVNNDDAVVGSLFVGFSSHAFIFRDGVLHDLGTLGGIRSEAFAVNNHGVVVGGSRLAPGGPIDFDHAFVFQDGAMRDIDAFGSFSSAAFGINDDGVAVGAFTELSSFQTFAFVWDASRGMRKLLDIPGSIATAINNRGDIIGTIGSTGAFLLSDGVLTRLEDLPGLKSAGFTRIFPEGINERGWIVGSAARADGTGAAIVLMPR